MDDAWAIRAISGAVRSDAAIRLAADSRDCAALPARFVPRSALA